MKIILSGGGTMGSVSPLIATAEEILRQRPKTEFLFLGSKSGPERKAVASYKIPFKKIASGKFRRYFSWRNFWDFFKIFWGFWESLWILAKFRPVAVMVAGSFVGVPVVWSAWLLRIPVLIHQQDIVPGLASRLMSHFARKISCSFEPSLKDFYPGKTVLTGNPVRGEFFSCSLEKSREIFELRKKLPVVLVLGGGTGAEKINQTVEKSLADILQFCQLIHLTGRGKSLKIEAENYRQFEFLTNEMIDAFCLADLVVSRAGMSSLSEFSILAKPVILIPIPDSHQEENARYFQKNNAVLVLEQNSLTPELFTAAVKELLFNRAKRQNLSRNISKMMKPDGARRAAEELLKIAE